MSLYGSVGQAAYETLFADGQQLYVPDRPLLDWWFKDKAEQPLGIPARAHFSRDETGQACWELIPEADNIAAVWRYTILPTAAGEPVVARVCPTEATAYTVRGLQAHLRAALVPVCKYSELWTLEAETEFRLLMGEGGQDA